MVVSKEIILEKGNIITVKGERSVRNIKGLGYEFFYSMLKYKDKVAQVDAENGEKDYYKSLLLRCIRTAMEMKHREIGPNDIISICSHNHLNTCVPFIAAFFLGTKVSCLDPKLVSSDIACLLSQTKPTMIFVDQNSVKLVKDAAEQASLSIKIVVFGPTDIETPFSEFLKPQPKEEQFKPIEIQNDKETAIILFSSGTTGFPKGICVNHYSLYNQSMPYPDHYSMDVCLYYTSLYWISAVLILTAALINGNTRIIHKEFNPTKTWLYVEKYKVTFMFLTPFAMYDLYNSGKWKGLNTSSLKQIFTGGTPISKNVLFDMQKILPGTYVAQGYGQTETTGPAFTFHTTNPEDIRLLVLRPESCGRPLPGDILKVVDVETGKAVGFNQWGELRIKSEFLMNGYYNLDSSSAFDEEGWLRTGDVFYYDEDFCFYIVDRIKEMLKFRSWHVAPAVLEKLLQTHPAVQAVVVVGVPDEIDGDHPMACVILKKGFENCTPEDIKKFVDEKVDDPKKLRGGVKIFQTFPKTPTDKIDRKRVRKHILTEIMV